MQFSLSPPRPPILHSHTHTTDKADSTLRSSQAVPHPSTNRALCRLTSEVRRDPVHSTWYGRRQDRWSGTHILLMQLGPGIVLSAVHNKDAESHDGHQHLLVMLRMLMMSLVMTSLLMMMGLMMVMVMMMMSLMMVSLMMMSLREMSLMVMMMMMMRMRMMGMMMMRMMRMMSQRGRGELISRIKWMYSDDPELPPHLPRSPLHKVFQTPGARRQGRAPGHCPV